MGKTRRIHLNDVCDLTSNNYGKEFQLNFYDFKKNLHVVLHLPKWWVGTIADKLWDIINDEQQELDKMKNAMKDGESDE